MSDRGNARLVYSTGGGEACQVCGWPRSNCQCSKQSAKQDAVPNRPVAKLRVEKAGRSGKTVTVVFDLPRNDAFVKALCHDLKKSCGTGGAVKDGTIELQGDHRERLREFLTKRFFLVKG